MRFPPPTFRRIAICAFLAVILVGCEDSDLAKDRLVSAEIAVRSQENKIKDLNNSLDEIAVAVLKLNDLKEKAKAAKEIAGKVLNDEEIAEAISAGRSKADSQKTADDLKQALLLIKRLENEKLRDDAAKAALAAKTAQELAYIQMDHDRKIAEYDRKLGKIRKQAIPSSDPNLPAGMEPATRVTRQSIEIE
jgi:hypothetical protein